MKTSNQKVKSKVVGPTQNLSNTNSTLWNLKRRYR